MSWPRCRRAAPRPLTLVEVKSPHGAGVTANAGAGGGFTLGFRGLFGYAQRALELTWTTSRPLSVALGALTLVAGAVPAGVAWVGARIVDGVVLASHNYAALGAATMRPVL